MKKRSYHRLSILQFDRQLKARGRVWGGCSVYTMPGVDLPAGALPAGAAQVRQRNHRD